MAEVYRLRAEAEAHRDAEVRQTLEYAAARLEKLVQRLEGEAAS